MNQSVWKITNGVSEGGPEKRENSSSPLSPWQTEINPLNTEKIRLSNVSEECRYQGFTSTPHIFSLLFPPPPPLIISLSSTCLFPLFCMSSIRLSDWCFTLFGPMLSSVGTVWSTTEEENLYCFTTRGEHMFVPHMQKSTDCSRTFAVTLNIFWSVLRHVLNSSLRSTCQMRKSHDGTKSVKPRDWLGLITWLKHVWWSFCYTQSAPEGNGPLKIKTPATTPLSGYGPFRPLPPSLHLKISLCFLKISPHHWQTGGNC